MTQKHAKIPPRPAKIIKASYRNLIIIFSLLAVCLVGAILYFALAQATVFITPNYSRQNVGFVVQVVDQKNGQPTGLDDQRIFGQVLETTQEASQEFPAQQVESNASKATGRLTVYNDYSQPQPLITKTRFASPDGLVFRLIRGVTVPANNNLEVEVEADGPGAQYEIPAADFILPALSELRRQYVYGKSTEPMKRETATKFQITQDIINQAKSELENQLVTQAKDELAKNLADKQSIINDSIATEVIKYSVSEQPESAKEKFTVSLSLVVKAVAIDLTELKKQAVMSLPASYSQNGALTKIDNDSFTYDVIFLDDNTENLLAQIKGEYALSVANVQINKDELKGLSKKEAETYLANLNGVAQASVRLPFWTKYLPALVDNINIIINDQ